jgi:hypothetical protein
MKQDFLIAIRLATMLLMLVAIPAAPRVAGAAEPAKNASMTRRVVPKSRNFKLRSGETKTERNVPLDFWIVEKAEGAKLSVRGERSGIVGFARADQVVDINQALAYFSGQIRDHKNGPFALVMRAMLWRDKNELDKAITDLDEAIHLMTPKLTTSGPKPGMPGATLTRSLRIATRP